MTLNQEIKINPEYSKLVPDLSNTEYELLKSSIKDKGQQYHIFIDENGFILEGHHRFKVCNELDIEPKIEVKRFANEAEKKKFVIRSNLHRRQLLLYQKAYLANEIHKIEQDRAKLRQIQAGEAPGKKTGKGGKETNIGKFLPKQLTEQEKAMKLEKARINSEKRKQKEYNEPQKPRKKSGKPRDSKKEEQGKSRERAAKQANLSDESLRQYQYVLKHGTKDIIEAMTKGWMVISEAYEKIQYLKLQEERRKEIERKEQEQKKEAEKKLNEWPKVYCSKFQDVDIPDNSVDLIFTDPPYDKEHLFLYKDLTELAITKLKPGGSLVCYANHYFLPQTFDLMKHEELEYWWTIGEFHQSQSHSKMFKQNVTVTWKPLLWFVKKGDKPHNVKIMTAFADSIKSQPPQNDKLAHKWEQSVDDALYIIEKLSDKGDIILDPMCGSGTTGLAALYLERKFIGIEIDKTVFEEAETRLKNYCWSSNNKTEK